MTEEMCERCKEKPVSNYNGDFIKSNLHLFKKKIGLCEKCDGEWGTVWEQSRIGIIYHDKQEEYENAYYKLFWNWFRNNKEVVQFT